MVKIQLCLFCLDVSGISLKSIIELEKFENVYQLHMFIYKIKLFAHLYIFIYMLDPNGGTTLAHDIISSAGKRRVTCMII